MAGRYRPPKTKSVGYIMAWFKPSIDIAKWMARNKRLQNMKARICYKQILIQTPTSGQYLHPKGGGGFAVAPFGRKYSRDVGLQVVLLHDVLAFTLGNNIYIYICCANNFAILTDGSKHEITLKTTKRFYQQIHDCVEGWVGRAFESRLPRSNPIST